MSIAARIERLSMGEPNSGCWLWLGTVPKSGYGRMDVKGKSYSAHRVAYEAFIGPPGKLFVLHRCDTPTCVNPRHLFLGTQQSNMADMARKGRHSCSRRTHCKRGHEYTPENTGRNGHDGSRWCRSCKSAQYRRKRAVIAAGRWLSMVEANAEEFR